MFRSTPLRGFSPGRRLGSLSATGRGRHGPRPHLRGITEADAAAAVFIQRLFTSYLPPIWGWLTLVWMRKQEYL